MRNLLMKVSYDGTDYNGFQTQPGGHTIQDYLEEAIRRLSGEQLKITASGRTDAGVHARAQVLISTQLLQFPLSVGVWH